MTEEAQAAPAHGGDGPPRRYIFTQVDMDAFRASPAKREFLGFVSAMGRSCASFEYDPSAPLKGLSPAMAALYGALCQMQTWLEEIPPDATAKARFGNPAFRTWHARLASRSRGMVQTILQQTGNNADEVVNALLEQSSEAGCNAAAGGTVDGTMSEQQEQVITELTAYLHDAFGHPTRLDYGTGHESSFLVFLYSLCKLGCFGNSKEEAPSTAILAPVALSIVMQYLLICRGLQTDYMLEPAGSHGVWGLDDYHCLPFYFGACQLSSTEHRPSAIHDAALLEQEGDRYMYFGCIRYIQKLKKGVPFFESSPMLNDISHLPMWSKVSSGLLRLYEGEVLDKMPVVQHFVFGNIFKASWTPSQQPREAPTRTFINGPGGDECIAPWAAQNSGDPPPASGLPPPTKAPWAK